MQRCQSVGSLGRCVDLRRHTIALDRDMLANLEFLKNRSENSIPIRIGPRLHQLWIIFCDGSSEPEAGTGAIGSACQSTWTVSAFLFIIDSFTLHKEFGKQR